MSPRPSAASQDAYADLLRESRGLGRRQAAERELWFSELAIENREEDLFELEVLLKGFACFANPRNHPGRSTRVAVVAQDFREATECTVHALHRVISLCQRLLSQNDRALVFQRYLETVLPDDRARDKLVRASLSQESPSASLAVLRHSMTTLLEASSGIARLPRVPFRLFYALLNIAQREVARSEYFNPLNALEFRPEFDRIENAHILEIMRSVPGESARRLVALTFLSLFRMLRYLSLIERTVKHHSAEPVPVAGTVYLAMSVLRSDARALSNYLRKRTGPLLAEGYEKDLFRDPAPNMAGRYEGLLSDGHSLLALKATLDGVSANLRLEVRRAFEHDFPPPSLGLVAHALDAAMKKILANLQPALKNAILFLAKSLGVRLDDGQVFDDAASRRVLSERLRRDVWMFAQIVRAFSQKARTSRSNQDEWGGISPLQFVREFLAYFRAMGYSLLRSSDYPRFDVFVRTMLSLQESDLLDPVRLQRAIDEADQFHGFLTQLFDQIGERDELRRIVFDRRAAAEALKLYLGSSMTM